MAIERTKEDVERFHGDMKRIAETLPQISKDEYIEQLHAERREFRRILEMIYSGVGDDVRDILEKKDPQAVTSIPVLYGTLARIKAKL